MSEHEPEETFDLDIDPMLFFAAVIEEQVEVLTMITDAGAAGIFGTGMGSLSDGVADIARDQIEQAQEQLDRLIAEDETWHDSYGTACVMVHDGHDTDGTEWNRCVVHGKQVLGDAYVCEGYHAPPYTGGH